ncbi:EAL domain-containing protein [Zavarzinia sp. CC-PAN008]|uniref:EAL domain-containing protein n=1 Tax=Zavarzinia sp. CC-PAN008 TaxID=3243332 RepID=UPI003F748D96
MPLSPHRLTLWLVSGLVLLTFMVLGAALAWEISLRDQRQATTIVAGIVLDRAAETTRQINGALAELAAHDGGQPCGRESIARMRRFDVSSSLLQGFGYIEGTRLRCSSFYADEAFDLGQPDFINGGTTRIYLARELPIAPGTPLLVVGSTQGYAAFVHPALIFMLVASDSMLSGLASLSVRQTMAASVPAGLDWSDLALSRSQPRGAGWHGDFLVAWAISPVWDHFAYAAVPRATVVAMAYRLAWVLVPLGLLAGILTLWLAQRFRLSRTALPSLLRGGLQRGEVFLVYQPVVDLATGRWAGAEALARWRRGNGELVPPDIFVPIAERHGLIGRLTGHVIATAIEDMAPFLRGQAGAFISLNISSIDLVRPELLPLLTGLARRERLPVNAIHLEITERELVDVNACAATIADLRLHGFMVGSDDFGVGYSNLAYLDSLTLDFLKIDRAFVANAFRGAPRTEIVDHIIGLARSRDLQMVAEGVERPEQRDALRQRGVHFAQGWLFSKPLEAADFREQFAAQQAANANAA